MTAQASAEAGGLPTAWLDGFLPSLVEAALRGQRLDAGELESTRQLGGEAARAGVALAAVVDLYLSAARLAWTRLPELAELALGQRLGAADLTRAGAAALRAADDALAAAADGFAATRRVLVRHEEAVRREFVDDLLSGQADVERLATRAEQFGLQLAAPHAVALVEGACLVCVVAQPRHTGGYPGTACVPPPPWSPMSRTSWPAGAGGA